MNEVAEIHHLFGLAGAVSAASSAGLFARLTRNADTADGHARALAVDPRAARCILDVLVAFGLASCDGGVYEASPSLLAFAEQTPLALDDTSALWTHAPAFLKTGEPFHDDRQPAKREAVYAGVVAGIGRLFAAPATDLAASFDRAPERVLDVGCGSGVWSLAIAERFPRTRVTGLDLPDVLGVFQARAIERGLRERIGTIGGDMHAVDIPQGAFDLAIIANVLRLEDPDRAARLVTRVAKAVAPGGELVVVDAMGDGTPSSDRSLSVYALHLALRTAHGRVYTREQIASWLVDAGLTDLRDVTLSDALGTVGAIRARRS